MDSIRPPEKRRLFRLSIRSKLLVAFVGIVLLFGSIHVYVVFQIVQNALRDEFFKKGLMLTQHLAYQLEEAVLFEDDSSIRQMLWQWKGEASEHGYALLVSADSQVVASTFIEGIPSGMTEANLPSGHGHQLRRVLDRDQAYLDVSVPLLQGAAGWVRLGLHEGPLRVPELKILRLLLGMILFFVILGVIGAIVFSRMITSPIERIVERTSSVDLDGDPVELDISTGDELEVLAGSFEDMTHRLQRSHQQLSEASRKGSEAQKLAALGLLASGIAHEINNPLAGIELGLKRIAKAPHDRRQIERYLPPMLSSLEHMQRVIRQTLRFARPEPMRFCSVSLKEMIDHALVLVHHKLIKHKITVERRNTGVEDELWTDPQSFTQILVNLMVNAVDAMPGGGTLTVSTANTDNLIHVNISDTGCGIDGAVIQRIWEPFFTTKEVGKGTGLGLSVTKTLVERMSGTIEVESKIGNGTSFRFSFPVEGAMA